MTQVARRLLITIPILFGVATVTFMLMRFVPGDPVDVMLGDQASSIDKSALRSELGLDRPLSVQYIDFISGLAYGRLGDSLHAKRPIAELILNRVPATLELTLGAMALAMALGIPLGALAAIKRGGAVDRFFAAASLVGVSMPTIWLGPVLVLIFSLKLDLLPVSERGGWEHLILPSITLGLSLAASLFQITRTAMLETVKQDFIVVARAKGLSFSRIYFKHALVPSAMPIITMLGLQFGALLTGTVIVETLFDWPGLGTLLYQAIQGRDYPLVQGCVVTIATIYVFVNLATDIAYTFANPRVRLT